MSQDSIRELLLAKGKELFQGPPEQVRFTGDAAADDFLNNLSQTPHAFVLGCIVDRQIPVERAWMIPYRLAEAIGDQSFRSFRALSLAQVRQLMTHPRPLHRFPDQMARNVHEGIGLIASRYGGNYRGQP